MDGPAVDQASGAAAEAPIALVRCSTEGAVAWANPAAKRLLGVAAGSDLLDVVHGQNREQLRAFLDALIAPGRTARTEVTATTGVPIELLASIDDDGTATVSAYDLSAFWAELDQVRASARTDHLTGLANRLAFFEAAQDARMRASIDGLDPAFVAIDLDQFKVINDTYGHSTGDRALCRVADVLRRHRREGETVARLGGDEFVVCVAVGGVERAAAFAAAVSAELARPAEVAGPGRLSISASFGVAALDLGADVGVALQDADIALYQAKVSGGGATVVHDGEGATDQLGRTVAQLRRRADVDTRTGLARDHVFEADLPLAVERARITEMALSLLLIDLDHFHDYNERYHYEAGHRALRAVAAAVGRAVRVGDRCYRYGGEEVAVLLPDTAAADAIATGERIRQAVEALAIPHDGQETGVLTVSLGVSSMGAGDRIESDWLVHGATVALYEAKDAGRNAVRVHLPLAKAPDIRPRR